MGRAGIKNPGRRGRKLRPVLEPAWADYAQLWDVYIEDILVARFPSEATAARVCRIMRADIVDGDYADQVYLRTFRSLKRNCDPSKMSKEKDALRTAADVESHLRAPPSDPESSDCDTS